LGQFIELDKICNEIDTDLELIKVKIWTDKFREIVESDIQKLSDDLVKHREQLDILHDFQERYQTATQ